MQKFFLLPTLSVEQKGERWELKWQDPSTGSWKTKRADPTDLLALKLLTAEESLSEIAQKEGVPRRILWQALWWAREKGYAQTEPSLVIREEPPYQRAWFPREEFRRAEVFTLQWHLTHRCDLTCRHCYDRSDRRALTWKEALKILEDFYEFCEALGVQGQISFSGGNPFLYPYFERLYWEAAERGFTLAVLGNPVPEEWLARLSEIEPPAFYQVSLEGLEAYNDFIRGPGHFKRTLKFLELLQKYEIPAAVMLTLHAGNLEEVFPLARVLKGRVDSFTFNRLALIGEGANLMPAAQDRFEHLLESFWKAREGLPYLHLKDNLFNRLLYQREEELVGGCTGYGCGAAFNFVALLPDGEVHACRKFPSYLGRMPGQSLLEIYRSPRARRYREGPRACWECRLMAVCRGCMAVIATSGGNPWEDRDPFCPGPIP